MPTGVPQYMQLLNQQDVHHYATLWQIERTDGLIFRFTDHDTILEYAGFDYLPAGGFGATAREKQAGVKDHNLEILGMLTSDAITEEDLRAGRYREAKVLEFVVDWRYPYSGYFQFNVYYLDQVTYTGEYWRANLSGQPAWLRRDVGWLFSFDCRHRLGDAFGLDGVAGCKFAVNLAQESGTVVAVDAGNPNRVFTTAAELNPAFLWTYGEVTWTSGLNIGFKQQVQNYVSGNVVFFELEFPYIIQVGDTFTAIPGCDRKFSTCKVIYNQKDNFGGFPYMPGTDRMIGGPIG